jgi:AraC-like DNA-binding protein
MQYNYIYPNMNFAHKTDCGPNYSEKFEDHYHLIYEMILLIDGDIELVLENKKYSMTVGDLAFIQPGQHHFITPAENTRYERYVLKFPQYEIPDELLPIIQHKSPCISVKNTLLPYLFDRMDWHAEHYDGNSMQILMECVLREIIVYFCSDVIPSPEENVVFYNEKMAKVVDYINENIAKPLRITDICEYFHYSKSYMCKEFSKCMNVPIKQYVRTKKILLADSLIHSGMKPTVVYRQCGFSDYSTFFRDYCKIIGRPPSSDDEE